MQYQAISQGLSSRITQICFTAKLVFEGSIIIMTFSFVLFISEECFSYTLVSVDVGAGLVQRATVCRAAAGCPRSLDGSIAALQFCH
jgi:hypothetical protein